MTAASDNPIPTPERFRSYLDVLARLQLQGRLRGKLDPSDIVQQSMLRAHQAWNEFRGSEAAELAAWLRRILARTIADAARDLHREKRDVNRERSLEAELGESSARLASVLAANEPTPSRKAAKNEEILRVAEALALLPDPQRDAVLLKHCKGMSLVEVGKQLGRTPAAVASLLRRGLAQLRERLAETDDAHD